MTKTLSKTVSLRVDGDRLNQTLEALAKIGQQPDGTIKRLAFTPEDLAARTQLSEWMESAGMLVRTDAGANIIGRYPGRDPDAAALATGSHIDTVFSGGRFDGSLGVIAGLEVARVLNDNDIQLHHPFEVIAFADEERTMVGSKAMTGTALDNPDRYDTVDDISIQACLTAAGGNWDNLASAQR
ncbi:MAG: M20/M25/M40 family metallo-hydrolase, partial [Cyanobacteria bacterium J06632_3]